MAASASALLMGDLPHPPHPPHWPGGGAGRGPSFLLDEAVPLLTLTGPGGVGKTRLALAIAQDVAAAFADGVVWVDLAPLADPDPRPRTVAAALALTPAPASNRCSRRSSSSCEPARRCSCDNCEHLLASVADLVAALPPACPALQVLATSRAPFRCRRSRSSRRALPLPSRDGLPERIAQSAAVQLFVDRASACVPDFALTAENAPAVAAICRHLDGLPLAIELAAARVNAWPPAALLARLARPLLDVDRRPARCPRPAADDARGHWLVVCLTHPGRATALSPPGRLCRRLHAGGGGDGHGHRGDPPDRVADGVLALVDASLLHTLEPADDHPRFGLLETIREYGLERLVEHGEEPAVRDAHAAWGVTLAEQAEQEGTQPASIRRVAIEYPNLRAALDWLERQGAIEAGLRLASALLWVHWTESHANEGLAWLARVLAREEPVAPAVQARALMTAGALAVWIRQDQAQARTWLAEGEALAQALGDQRGRGDSPVLAGVGGGGVRRRSGDGPRRAGGDAGAQSGRWAIRFGLPCP